MGYRQRPLFDLNELPTEVEDENASTPCFQPQNCLPTSYPITSGLYPPTDRCQGMINNNAFTHASSVSGFQPFARFKDSQNSKESMKQKVDDLNSNQVSSSPMTVNSTRDDKGVQLVSSSGQGSQAVEREEGEWSDMEETDVSAGKAIDNHEDDCAEISQKQKAGGENEHGCVMADGANDSVLVGNTNTEVLDTSEEVKSPVPLGSEGSKVACCTSKGDVPADVSEEPLAVVKPKDVKGVEASHALRLANNPGKWPKLDEHKKAMLGKKRPRQTVFINVEDAKQAGSMKTSTPKRQASFPATFVTRTIKETSRTAATVFDRATEKSQLVSKEHKQSEMDSEGSTPVELSEQKDSNGDIHPISQSRSKKVSNNKFHSEVHPPSIPRQGSWKQGLDSRQVKNPPVPNGKSNMGSQNDKKHLPSKKQISNNLQYQDTSVERLLREVTDNDKFWHHPEEIELQCVPGCFDSVEEYVRIFEPLLFEECRAQLYSTWEEVTETVSRDAHIMVCVRTVERRERDTMPEWL